jgi:hypothetical protein
MIKKYLLVGLLFISGTCLGGYTANHSSKVCRVKIYNSDIIYFGLEVMPGDHQCSGNFMALSPSLTEKQRDRYYSMLLLAKTSGSTVSVGYDKEAPDCYSSRPIVHALELS